VRRCKHTARRVVGMWTPMAPGVLPSSVVAEVNVCSTCRTWFSLGPANDTPEAVRAEILGAFLYAEAAAFVNVAHDEDHDRYDFGSWRERCVGCCGEDVRDAIAEHDSETTKEPTMRASGQRPASERTKRTTKKRSQEKLRRRGDSPATSDSREARCARSR